MGYSKFDDIQIEGIVTVIPENRLDIDDEVGYYENELHFRRNKEILGLGTRYAVDDKTSITDLCEYAAQELMKELKIDKNEIDAVIFASASHDYHAPASACIIHGRLDLKEDCSCFDIAGVSCSGYVYALWVAHSLITSGAVRNCLLLAGDINSKHTNIQNRNTCILYSDAGSATFITQKKGASRSYFYLGSKGKDWDKIVAPSTGLKLAVRADISDLEIKDLQGNITHLWEDILSGIDVFKFAMDYAPQNIQKLLQYSNLKIDDIDFFPMHQANKQIMSMIAKHSGIPKNKYSSETFTKYANSGISAITTNICDNIEYARKSRNMLVSFGVGLSWGNAVVDLQCTKILGIKTYKSRDDALTRRETIEYWVNRIKNGV